MKYLILAAGKGTRLKHYTEDLPKGMLKFAGYPILKYHLKMAERLGFTRQIIVKGYKESAIAFPGVSYYVNNEYDTTNMVESMMRARNEFDDDLVVSYADIIYNPRILKDLVDFSGDFVVTVDMNWKKYWQMRYEKVDFDTESLSLFGDGTIRELGSPDPPVGDIHARYVGLLKFSVRGLKIIEGIYEEAKKDHWNEPWQKSGKPFRNAYMTDLLQEIIDQGYPVKAMPIENGWIELDTVDDYEKARYWLETGTLKREFDIDLASILQD